MIARLRLSFLIGLIPAVAAACEAVKESTPRGSNTKPNSGRMDAGELAPHDQGGAPDGSVPDSAVALPCEPGQPLTNCDGGVLLYETHFEGPNECAEWTATGAVVSTVPGHSGNGCMLCASADTEAVYMRRDVPAIPQVDAGWYAITLFSKAIPQSDAGPPPSSHVAFSFDGQNGKPMLASGTTQPSWSTSQYGRSVPSALPDNVLGIYLGGGGSGETGSLINAGDCFAFDDLRVEFAPEMPPH